MKQPVIFDMDGVLLDTERLIWRCWGETEGEFGITGTQAVLRTLFGTNQENFSRQMKAHYGQDFPYDAFHEAYRSRFFAITDAEGVPVKKGARELLDYLKGEGAPLAVASSTRREVVERELESAGLLYYFDHIVGGRDIAKSKPAPDIYLLACRRLGADPADCYGIEDSYNGVRSVHNAGMHPIMVPDQLPPTAEMEQLAAIFPDLLALRDFWKEGD